MSSKAYSTSTTADQRVQLETTAGGQFVGPAATVANPGSLQISTGQASSVNLSGKYAIGMSGAEVKELLAQQSLVSQSMLDAQATASTKLADLATTALQVQSATPIDWQKYIPYIVGGVVVIAVWGKRKGRAA